jgi:hypothetical protein
VRLSTTERTAKIATAGIAGMGEKQNLTMFALRQAFSQVGILFEDPADNPIILRSDTANLFLAVPVRNKLKTRL